MNKGEKITINPDKSLRVPDHPILPFIEGDGIGPDIWRASKIVLDAAVEKAYCGKRKIIWQEIFAGEKAHKEKGKWLPKETLDAIRDCKVAIKGPLSTPVGGGIRSVNVALRQNLDLYACVRPVRYFEGVPSPVKEPQKLNIIIFRENTEDLYSGIEWAAGTPEAEKVRQFLVTEMGANIRENSGIGIKPMSAFGTKRLVRKAIRYALDHGRKRVTLVHKGNIMKFTEGAFRQWGYDVAQEEFNHELTTGRLEMNDRIADAMFQMVLLRPEDYQVIALPNLNGDYISDACAAQVGGLGMAPGANIGDEAALFEATHGTAPTHAFKDEANPSSMILSGVMLLEYIKWPEAAVMITKAIEKTIKQKTVTYDLERLMTGATKVSCSEYGKRIVENMG